MTRERLQINPDPIKIVPDAQREVWTRQPGWRCFYEDGRGRCTSRNTKPYPFLVSDGAEWLCDKHKPERRA